MPRNSSDIYETFVTHLIFYGYAVANNQNNISLNESAETFAKDKRFNPEGLIKAVTFKRMYYNLNKKIRDDRRGVDKTDEGF